MRAYKLDFKRGLFLAPLSGYTSWPMRMLCREYGAELCYTEMISAAGLIRNTQNTGSILKRPPEDAPLVAQIFTNSPEDAAQAAHMIEDQGFDGIDINMGCPVKKVVSKGGGVALMTDPELAVRLAQAVIRRVNIPVSIKMRAGWDSSKLNAATLAESLEYAGADSIILHPRTRCDMYRGSPRWEVLQEVKNRITIPVIASGDIRTSDDVNLLKAMGADAFMIGRGAIGRPWIFRELTGGPSLCMNEHKELMLRHLDMLCICHGSRSGVRHMRKFLSSYVKGLHGAAHFRMEACLLDKPDLITGKIEEYFAGIDNE
jgi:nifR3 family TIM-barrel protein